MGTSGLRARIAREIRARFRTLRDAHMPAGDAIEQIRDEHPYLQWDTIRKIVYRAA